MRGIEHTLRKPFVEQEQPYRKSKPAVTSSGSWKSIAARSLSDPASNVVPADQLANLLELDEN